MKHKTSLNGRTASLDTLCRPKRVFSPRTVVELGAHSLKFHSFQRGGIRTAKRPYALGHDVYAWGRISEATVLQTVELIRESGLEPDIAVGTSAIRDAENRENVVHTLETELSLAVHVLSGWEEASLLVAGYLAHSKRLPALVVDIGGGSVELVSLNSSRNILWDSLPLGAIRLYHRALRDGRSDRFEWLEREFRSASIVHAEEANATGGTVKAIARTLQRSSFSRDDLERLEARVRADGPPPGLKSGRARVFLSGLVLVRTLCEFVGAERVNYMDISVGRVYLSPFGERHRHRVR